jgi:hypothetical protein
VSRDRAALLIDLGEISGLQGFHDRAERWLAEGIRTAETLGDEGLRMKDLIRSPSSPSTSIGTGP